MNKTEKCFEIKLVCRLINLRIPADFLLSILGIKLNSRGRGNCPFHSSKSKNCLSYDKKRDRFHCFHCNRDWSKIDFYKDVKGLTLNQAIDELGHHIGIRVVGKDYSNINARMIKDPLLVNIDGIRQLKEILNDIYNDLIEKHAYEVLILRNLLKQGIISHHAYYGYQNQQDYEISLLDEKRLIVINKLKMKENKLNDSFRKKYEQ